MRRVLIVGLVAVFSLSACSFIAVRGPTEAHPKACTRSNVAPILDIVGALVAGGVVAFGGVAIAGGGADHDTGTVGGAMLISGLLGITFIASSFYGFAKTAQCRAEVPDESQE
jgi:hypothetical protein